MFAGVSGLLNNAEGISVIGNNIANVNTVGFKSGRMLFSDVLSANIGNGSQIGRGSQIQKVDNIFSQNTFETTQSVTDLAIEGNSFFAVKDPATAAPANQNSSLLTRAGAFRLDNSLTLVNPDGYQVLDTAGNPIKFSDNATAIAALNTALAAQASIPATAINTLVNPQVPAAGTFVTAVLTAAAAAYNTQAGTIVTDSGTFNAAATAALATVPPTASAAESAAATAILTAANTAQTAATTAVATPTAANISAAQAAFTALNTTTNNSTFTSTAMVSAFTTFRAALTAMNTANNAEAPTGEINAALAIQTAANTAQSAATTAITTPNASTLAGVQNAFNALTTLTNNSSFSPAPFVAAYVTFQGLQNTANTAVNAAMTTAAPSIASATAQLATANGLAFSKISSIDSSGLITYLGKDGITTNFYNGSGMVGVPATVANAATVQRLAVVSVTNTGGLEKVGGTLFRPSVSSGVTSGGFSLSANTANGSSERISSNSLEQSNVDMAGEFVKMILTQRAYSANSKTITTADEMTQEVLNLKR
jgi:flagellar hook protein FlgE